MSLLSDEYTSSDMSASRRVVTRASRSHAATRMMSRNVRRLQETVNLHLNSYEKELFLDALNDYNYHRDTWAFVETLRTILNTPAKQQLVPIVRLVLPPADITEFDKCVQLSAAVARREPGAYRIADAVGAITSSQSIHNRSSLRLKSLPPTNKIAEDLNIIQIRPGSHGLGFATQASDRRVLVTAVDVHSDAHVQGLEVGDEIVEANDIDLTQISHQEATQVLKAAKSLALTVRHKTQASQTKHNSYTWIDTDGRPCSPPVTTGDMNSTLRSSVSKRSGMTLISNQNERKINLHIEKGRTLGLTIRGGLEYGLGIFITGVDPGSAAKQAGIRVGDQILSVNDVQFLDIRHDDAVKTLKRSRHMMLTIKHVGKLPHARLHDPSSMVARRSASVSSRRSRPRTRADSRSGDEFYKVAKMRYPGSLDRIKYRQLEQRTGTPAVFLKGAGSQLMFQNDMLSSSLNFGTYDEQAKVLLNEQERSTLKYYVDDYLKGLVSIEALVTALSELFNSPAKFQMFHALESVVQPRDLKKYSALVLKQEVQSLKTRHNVTDDHLSDFSLDSVLSGVGSPDESLSLDLSPAKTSDRTDSGKGSARSGKMLITDGSSRTITTDPSLIGSVKRQHAFPSAESQKWQSPTPDTANEYVKTVPRMGTKVKTLSKPDGKPPAYDSGVEVKVSLSSNDNKSSRSVKPPHESASDSDVTDHHSKSYSLNGDNDEDSEDDPIPGLNSYDNVSTDQAENVVLLKNDYKSTFPRGFQVTDADMSDEGRTNMNFQNINRSLSGRTYSGQKSVSQRQQLPVNESDYDTADIIEISKELLSASQYYKNGDEIQDFPLPPPLSTPPPPLSTPPPKLTTPPPPVTTPPPLDDSDTPTVPNGNQSSPGGSPRENSSRYSMNLEDDYAVPYGDNTSEHPAILYGKSPIHIRKSIKSDGSNDIYAVVKKQNQNRPVMSFPAPPTDFPPSSLSRESQETLLETQQISDSSLKTANKEELQVVRVNKQLPKLGIAIEGGAGTNQHLPRIINIQASGCAYATGLKSGHVIHRVNECVLDGLSHAQAARTIADAFRDKNSNYIDFYVS